MPEFFNTIRREPAGLFLLAANTAGVLVVLRLFGIG